MLILAAFAAAAPCSWSTPLWNDGELAFRHPDATQDLAKIDAGSAYFDQSGAIQPGSVMAPSVRLSLERDGRWWVSAYGKAANALGVVELPVAVLHPTKALLFGDVVLARGQDTVRLRGETAQGVLVEPQLPAWYQPNGDVARAVLCRDVGLSIRTRAAELWQGNRADGGLIPDVDIAISAKAGGPPAGKIRCEIVGEKSDSVSWAEYTTRQARECPPVQVVEAAGEFTKIKIEAHESVVEGWVPASTVGTATSGFAYGLGGLGMRPKTYRCKAERLFVLAEGKAFAVATLPEGTVVKQLLVLDEGWTQIRIPDANWLSALEGELVMAPEAFARCTPIDTTR